MTLKNYFTSSRELFFIDLLGLTQKISVSSVKQNRFDSKYITRTVQKEKLYFKKAVWNTLIDPKVNRLNFPSGLDIFCVTLPPPSLWPNSRASGNGGRILQKHAMLQPAFTVLLICGIPFPILHVMLLLSTIPDSHGHTVCTLRGTYVGLHSLTTHTYYHVPPPPSI
jgi:hypothetical protein